MLLKNILDDLIRNELGNLSIGKPEWSTNKFNYVSLIQCISLAYIELHKRFSLSKEIVHLLPRIGINEYVLDILHADSNTTSTADKYILDSIGRPFSNNIAKIDQIYLSDGVITTFNSTDQSSDISLLDFRTLYIKNPGELSGLTVVCRALPKPITLANELALETYELVLPTQYLEALMLYAAGRAYVNRGAENATNNESSIFFARFEQACAAIQQYGLSDKEELTGNRLALRGFI